MMYGGKCGVCAIETPVGPVSLGKCFSTIHLPIQQEIGEFDSLPHLVEMFCLEVLADLRNPRRVRGFGVRSSAR